MNAEFDYNGLLIAVRGFREKFEVSIYAPAEWDGFPALREDGSRQGRTRRFPGQTGESLVAAFLKARQRTAAFLRYAPPTLAEFCDMVTESRVAVLNAGDWPLEIDFIAIAGAVAGSISNKRRAENGDVVETFYTIQGAGEAFRLHTRLRAYMPDEWDVNTVRVVFTDGRKIKKVIITDSSTNRLNLADFIIRDTRHLLFGQDEETRRLGEEMLSVLSPIGETA